MQNTTNNLGGALRTAGLASLKGSPEQCIANEPSREIPDELRMLHTNIEDLESLMSRLIERLDPVSCHTPQPAEKMAEPPPNKTKAGQAIRDARVRITVVCSKLSEQLDALEL